MAPKRQRLGEFEPTMPFGTMPVTEKIPRQIVEPGNEVGYTTLNTKNYLCTGN
ncbi:MAG: hypothetical protein ABSC42_13435 [Tepidisphaeraceae bacterium]|jgi:hypothetical protein